MTVVAVGTKRRRENSFMPAGGDVAITRPRTRRASNLQKPTYRLERDVTPIMPNINRNVILRKLMQQQVKRNKQREEEEETLKVRQLEEEEERKKQEKVEEPPEEIVVEDVLLEDTVDPEEKLRVLDKKLDELSKQKHTMFLLLKHILSEDEKRRHRETELRRQQEEQQRMLKDTTHASSTTASKKEENAEGESVNIDVEELDSPIEISSPTMDRRPKTEQNEKGRPLNDEDGSMEVDAEGIANSPSISVRPNHDGESFHLSTSSNDPIDWFSMYPCIIPCTRCEKSEDFIGRREGPYMHNMMGHRMTPGPPGMMSPNHSYPNNYPASSPNSIPPPSPSYPVILSHLLFLKSTIFILIYFRITRRTTRTTTIERTRALGAPPIRTLLLPRPLTQLHLPSPIPTTTLTMETTTTMHLTPLTTPPLNTTITHLQ